MTRHIGECVDDIYDRGKLTGCIADLVLNSLSASGHGGNFANGIVLPVPGCTIVNIGVPRNVTYASFDVSLASISGHVRNPNPVKENIVKNIDGLSDEPELYEEGEPAPSAATKDDARNLILGLYPSGSLAGADVYPCYGAIHISWETSRKKVKLIVPPHSSGQRPSIYHGQMDNGRVTKSSIEPEATSETLFRWLEWLPG